ncbi:MAG: hypothetical protein ACREGJ_03775 [Candidatus Saccharimonadales bacterium]
MDPLQLFLVAGLVVLAMVNAASLIWASYLDHRLRGRPTSKQYAVQVDASKILSEIDVSQVQKQASEQLHQTVHDEAQRLQQSVAKQVDQLVAQVNETTTAAISQEFEKYQISLQGLRDQSIEQFSQLQQELDQRRDQLLAELDKEVAKERERRLNQFDERLNSVVASYVAESLGNQVDLGAQMSYILQSLQKRKEDIKRDMLS